MPLYLRVPVVLAFLACAARAAGEALDTEGAWSAFMVAAAISHLGLAIVFALGKEA